MLGANMTESLRKLRAASEAAARTQAANSPVKP
jgi:hypothetical protein